MGNRLEQVVHKKQISNCPIHTKRHTNVMATSIPSSVSLCLLICLMVFISLLYILIFISSKIPTGSRWHTQLEYPNLTQPGSLLAEVPIGQTQLEAKGQGSSCTNVIDHITLLWQRRQSGSGRTNGRDLALHCKLSGISF